MSNWSKEEENYLKEHYSEYSLERILSSDTLSNRSEDAIRSKIRRIGLENKYNSDDWIEEEMNKLYEVYPFEEKDTILGTLPSKSWEEIKDKAEKENLTRFDGDEVSLSDKGYSFQTTEINLNIDGEKINLLPFGDIHFGHPASNLEMARDTLKKLEKDDKDFRIILMGDLWEGATAESPNSEFEIEYTPQEQYQTMLSVLNKYSDKILGCLVGNHEQFTDSITGLDKMRDFARELNIPFFKYRGYIRLNINGIRYNILAQHGSTGSRGIGGKMRNLKRMNEIVPTADIYLYAHTHQRGLTVDNVFEGIGNSTVQRNRYYALTGSFLEYPGTYASRKDYSPSSLGTIRFILSSKEKAITAKLK